MFVYLYTTSISHAGCTHSVRILRNALSEGRRFFDERNCNQTGGSILDHVTKWASEFRHGRLASLVCVLGYVVAVSHRSM